jgi:hypothetical protein
MRLSGIVFLAIGAVVAIASFLLSAQGQKMKLFMFVGIAMAVFGAIRFYVDRTVQPEQVDERRAKMASDLPHVHRPLSEIPRVCSTCHTKNNPKANFCGHCGHKL